MPLRAPASAANLRFLRLYLGMDTSDPAVSLYEIDGDGWVHCNVHIEPDSVRFAPEDVLLVQPVNLAHMLAHPASELVDAADFALLWDDVSRERPFSRRVPDPEEPWQGGVEHGGRRLQLAWWPAGAGATPGGYRRVAGFVELLVRGDAADARRAAAAVFLERPIAWLAWRGGEEPAANARPTRPLRKAG